MKNFLKIMVNMLMIAAFAATTVSCSKDDDEDNNGLIGRWVFQEASMNFLYEGHWYNSKEEGMDMTSYLSDFHGMYWIFEKDGTVVIGVGGQSGSAKYRVSGDELIIDGTSMGKYRISGKTLDLIWKHATFRAMGVDDSELYELGIDDYEMILTFTKS
jgi:hypothetical protein